MTEGNILRNCDKINNYVNSLSDLPYEVLVKVFNYVENRWNLAQVCWKFYEIVCDVERNNLILKLIDVNMMSSFLRNTMIYSRNFNIL